MSHIHVSDISQQPKFEGKSRTGILSMWSELFQNVHPYGYLRVGSIWKFCPQMACCSSGSYSQASHQRDSRSWVNRVLGNKSGDINYSSTPLEHIGNAENGINTSISISLVFESLPGIQKSHPLDLSLTMSPFLGCQNDYHKRRKTKPSQPSKHLTHQFLLLWSFHPAFMCCDAWQYMAWWKN